MSDDKKKVVVFVVTALVPEDFYAETQIYGLDTRTGWVDEILAYNGCEIPRGEEG